MIEVRRQLADLIANNFGGTYLGLLDQAKTEINKSGYSRISFTGFNYVAEDTDYFIYGNGATLEFSTAGEDWDEIYYIGFYDALSGGNLIALFSLPSPILIRTGQKVIFLSNMINLKVPKTMT